MVEFNEDDIIKAKEYLVNIAVKEKEHHLIIEIPYDKFIFFVNDRI